MEDRDIVSLYWQRSEEAIARSQEKYGSQCLRLAENILSLREDAEECVSDTWLAAWNAMPIQRPEHLGAWLGRVVRNLAIDRWRRLRTRKRFDGMEVLLSELGDCVPAPESTEAVAERHRLGKVLSDWLDGLPAEDRWLFVRRYWYGDMVADLSRARGETPQRMAKRLYRLRLALRDTLEKEEIFL